MNGLSMTMNGPLLLFVAIGTTFAVWGMSILAEEVLHR